VLDLAGAMARGPWAELAARTVPTRNFVVVHVAVRDPQGRRRAYRIRIERQPPAGDAR